MCPIPDQISRDRPQVDTMRTASGRCRLPGRRGPRIDYLPFLPNLMGYAATMESRPQVRGKARHSRVTLGDHVPVQAALF
jgi:hypothetical protein